MPPILAGPYAKRPTLKSNFFADSSQAFDCLERLSPTGPSDRAAAIETNFALHSPSKTVRLRLSIGAAVSGVKRLPRLT